MMSHVTFDCGDAPAFECAEVISGANGYVGALFTDSQAFAVVQDVIANTPQTVVWYGDTTIQLQDGRNVETIATRDPAARLWTFTGHAWLQCDADGNLSP